MEELFDFLRTKKISVISPAGKVDSLLLSQAINFFSEKSIHPNVLPNVCCKGNQEIYHASSLKNRLSDLYEAWNNSDIIICSRGGYGCSELAENIDWNILKKDTVVIGYSDITALHLAMLKNSCGIPVSGMMFLKFSELSKNVLNSQSLLNSLSSKSFDLSKYLKFIKYEKPYCGEVIPANLTVLASLCGTNLLPDFSNKVLVIEDVNEPYYKLHRSLTQLRQNGILAKLSGLIFGDFGNLPSNELDFLVAEFVDDIKNIVAIGFPFGHGDDVLSINMSLNSYHI